MSARRRVLLWSAVFAGAALISGFTILRDIDYFDEGLALQAGRRVYDGQMPYRDFLWAYGPAGPYLFGLLRDLFGPSLLDWRILRVLVDAGIATTVFALARRADGSPLLAPAGWLLAACAIAQPRSANPFPYALLLALLAYLVATGERPARPFERAAAAGALLGFAAAFRIDFAVYGSVAVMVALALRPRGARVREVAACAVAAAVVAGVAYAPFAIAIGPGDLYDALIGKSLREASYWRLPFPLSYHGGLGGPTQWKDVLDFYLPLLLVLGSAAALVACAVRWRARMPRPAVALGLMALAAGCLLYLRSRTDPFHTQPLDVVLAALLPIAIAATRRTRVLPVVLAAILALLTIQAVGNRASALVQPPDLSTVHVTAADGVQAPPADARALERTVGLVDTLVAPGEPIYVLPRRFDLAPISAPLLYVLTDRENPEPQDHGLLTGAGAQRSTVALLERVRPGALVRWTDPLSSLAEPNRRGRPTGVHTVDDWVAANYRLRQRAGHFDVLVPR